MKLALAAAALVSVAAAPTFAVTHQVPQTYATIGAALAASLPGDVVQVAPGTYSGVANGETFPLAISANVALVGAGMGLSILDAAGSAGVVSLNTATGGRVSGFTIRGGRADRGGGVFVGQGSPEIDHNLVIQNAARFRGAGIFVAGETSPTSAPWIHHNVLWQNFDADPSDAVDPHGLLVAGTATGIVEQNLFGRTDGNGNLTSETAQPTIRNNIYFENGVTVPAPPRGRGICWLSSSPPVLYHNIFWNNVIAAVLWPSGGGNISGTVANAVSATDQVYGNLDVDPQFVNVGSLNFHLQPGSPAIDAGDPALPHDPDGTIADIGPFWFDQSATDVPSVEGREGGLALFVSPNPFLAAAGTSIRWATPHPGSVSVEIVNVAGRRVRALGAANGAHELRWDGRTSVGDVAASGVYLVVLRSGNVTKSAPVLLLR